MNGQGEEVVAWCIAALVTLLVVLLIYRLCGWM